MIAATSSLSCSGPLRDSSLVGRAGQIEALIAGQPRSWEYSPFIGRLTPLLFSAVLTVEDNRFYVTDAYRLEQEKRRSSTKVLATI